MSAQSENAARSLSTELRQKLAIAEVETGRLSVDLMVARDRLERERQRGNDLQLRLNQALDRISHMERSVFWKLRQFVARLTGRA